MALFRLFLLSALFALFSSEDVKSLLPVARINKKNLKIGEEFLLSVHVDYPSEYQILFPDSTYDFGNFILKRKTFYPTKSFGEISRDCVLYQMACFHPDSVQIISIPVLQFNQADTIRFMSNQVKVNMFAENPEVKEFQTDTIPVSVAQKVNLPYLIGGFVLIILILGILNLFLDKPIQRFFNLWMERRRHDRFIKSWSRMQENLESDASIQGTEAMLVLWKKYLQRLEGRPFITFTSREINQILPDARLKKSLQEIDKWIYGGMAIEDLPACLQGLKEKSIELYEIKRNQIRDGKVGKSL